MMNQKCKKAMVIIGNKQKIEYSDVDVYFFPIDIDILHSNLVHTKESISTCKILHYGTLYNHFH